MPHMKFIGKLGLLLGIILSILVGLNTLNYLWLLPIITFQTLSYYLFHFKNFKFKKIGKRNNPFIKELPHHLMIQSCIVFMCFGLGLGLDILFEHEAYASLLGQITQFFDAINFAIDAIKQTMVDLYNAILQSRFN
jgi:hypothetical protein